ncbi:hypothetical protein AZZ98_001586, partial [Serratia marcescens]
PRQGSTKRLRFGPPTAARRVSAANLSLLPHRQKSPNANSGFFIPTAQPLSGACAP